MRFLRIGLLGLVFTALVLPTGCEAEKTTKHTEVKKVGHDTTIKKSETKKIHEP